MKIVPIVSVNNFKGASDGIRPFKQITSKTAENLYNTDFNYSDKNFKYCFQTFVLAEKSGEPIEVYVKPRYLQDSYEEFEIYQYIKYNGLSCIGMRRYEYDLQSKKIIPGYMEAEKIGLKGIGFRLHQITFERMLMRCCKNIELLSTPQAYPFHNALGYIGSKESGILNLSKAAKKDWLKIIQKQPILIGKAKF